MDNATATGHFWDVLIRPRDPLILRDARPFTADPGAHAFSLDWPLPSTLAGALRTHIGSSAGVNWEAWKSRRNGQAQEHPLQRLEVLGGLRADRAPGDTQWRIGVPAPADALTYQHDDDSKECAVERLVPEPLRGRGLQPATDQRAAAPSHQDSNHPEVRPRRSLLVARSDGGLAPRQAGAAA
ncbi:MAG: hypothetical protein C4289_08255 [Chloroflexota bacterium]